MSTRRDPKARHSAIDQQIDITKFKSLKSRLKMLDKVSDVMIPELLSLLSNETSSTQRHAYRDYVGSGVSFHTANKMSRLCALLDATCSEKSREIGRWRKIEEDWGRRHSSKANMDHSHG
jgi:hypothetical protein